MRILWISVKKNERANGGAFFAVVSNCELRGRNAMRVSVQTVLLFVLVVGVGCAPPKPYQTTLVMQSLQVHDQAEVTQDNVTISVTPILPDNGQSFPDIYKMVTWTATRNDVLGKPETYQAQGASSILPEPAFQIRIANHTGHVIRLTQTVFRLQDDRGKTYQTYDNPAAIESWLENIWTSSFGPQVATAVKPQFHPAFENLLLLNRNVELLDGDQWTGYLVFNLGINKAEDFAHFMESITRLTLRLAEVPVEFAEDGTVSRTTEFTFHLDRTALEFDVTCPGSVKTPDLVNCTKE